jgi:hypothetical protein
MDGKRSTVKEIINASIIGLPFITSVILLMLGLSTLTDIHLENTFKLNFDVVIAITLGQVSAFILLSFFGKNKIIRVNSILIKLFIVLIVSILTFLSSMLLEMGLRMNLNNWLKDNKVEQIELLVTRKKKSCARVCDYYIYFNSGNELLTLKVGKNYFIRYEIGEIYKASVTKGYFDGYFLTEPMKRVKLEK